MRKKVILVFLVALIFTAVVNAQTPPGPEGHDRMLRLSLVHFLDFSTPGPHLSFEHRLKENDYLRHEIGWIDDFAFPITGNVQDVSGFRVRSGHRRYVSNPGQIKRRLFREISVSYRSLEVTATDLFQLGEISAFAQMLPYEVRQTSLTLDYIKGLSVPLGKAGRWQLDIGIGFGLRLNKREFSELPQGVLPDDVRNRFLFSGSAWDYNRRGGRTVGLSLPMIGALGYRF